MDINNELSSINSWVAYINALAGGSGTVTEETKRKIIKLARDRYFGDFPKYDTVANRQSKAVLIKALSNFAYYITPGSQKHYKSLVKATEEQKEFFRNASAPFIDN